MDHFDLFGDFGRFPFNQKVWFAFSATSGTRENLAGTFFHTDIVIINYYIVIYDICLLSFTQVN